MNKDIII